MLLLVAESGIDALQLGPQLFDVYAHRTMWMVGEDGKIAGMAVVDMGGWRLQLGFAVGCEIQLVAGKFGADEVAGCEFVRTALGLRFGVDPIAPNLVVHLCKLVAMFGNVPQGEAGSGPTVPTQFNGHGHKDTRKRIYEIRGT